MAKSLKIRLTTCKKYSLQIGQIFGRWTIIRCCSKIVDNKGRNDVYYLCKCKCGNENEVEYRGLARGISTSCGCFNKEQHVKATTKHGGSYDKLYGVHNQMIARCDNENNHEYKWYGERGISVCKEWRDYSVFRNWALASGYQPGLTIERKDVNGNYEPNNCTWIPRPEQNRNLRKTLRITAFGETKVFREWSRDSRCIVSPSGLISRLRKGWNPELAITTPPPKRFLRLNDVRRTN